MKTRCGSPATQLFAAWVVVVDVVADADAVDLTAPRQRQRQRQRSRPRLRPRLRRSGNLRCDACLRRSREARRSPSHVKLEVRSPTQMSDDFPIESRFSLEDRIGRGASGDVYRAFDCATGLTVAVKRLLALPDEPTLVDCFWREARLLADRRPARGPVRPPRHRPDWAAVPRGRVARRRPTSRRPAEAPAAHDTAALRRSRGRCSGGLRPCTGAGIVHRD